MNTSEIKKGSHNYETASEAINELQKLGYTTDFAFLESSESIICNPTGKQLSPEEFEIDDVFRFEGMTDPGDEMIVFAISSLHHGLKGLVVDAYGAYSSSRTSRIVEKLHKHSSPISPIQTSIPIKRDVAMRLLSHDHHQGLLLCWKIRMGVKRHIAPTRIKKYADWFYAQYLLPHFEMEEKQLFPLLGNEHKLIQKAISDHRQLTHLFQTTTDLPTTLLLIADELDAHIRFEERVVFNEIQIQTSPAKLLGLGLQALEKPFKENENDIFWL